METRLSIPEMTVVVLEFALALGGLMGGVGLLIAPDGRNLGWTTEPLQGTPFGDYFVPAALLLAINGIFPLIVAVAALRGRPWARWGHLAVGCLLVGWIGGQLVLIGYLSLLQPLFGALGFIITALALVVIATIKDGTQGLNRERARPRRRITTGCIWW